MLGNVIQRGAAGCACLPWGIRGCWALPASGTDGSSALRTRDAQHVGSRMQMHAPRPTVCFLLFFQSHVHLIVTPPANACTRNSSIHAFRSMCGHTYMHISKRTRQTHTRTDTQAHTCKSQAYRHPRETRSRAHSRNWIIASNHTH